jgi:O-antigen/teichoic acid export membrane protein
LSLLAAASVTVLIVLAAPWLAGGLFGKPELATPLRWMALTILPQTQMQLHAQMLRGLERIALAQLVRNVDVPLLTMIFVAILGGAYGATGAVWSFTLANVVAGLGASWMWRRAAGRVDRSADALGHRELLRSGIPILQSNLLDMLLKGAATLLLGAFSSSHSVAIFAVAFRTAMLTRFALMAADSISAPRFAALHSTADRGALATTSRRSALLITLAASPVLLFFVAFPGWTMGIFGEAFRTGGTVLLILACGQFIAVLCGSVGYLLMMSGNERRLRNNMLVAGVFSLVLNLILIPRLGATGAALSVALAITLRSLLGSLQVYRSLGILPFFIPGRLVSPKEAEA